ncbi:hypothetical protein PSA7680_02423 [Pseudoruegeria aquimaris]|uniref:Helix-turn-helix domain-containing protein n=1 Tax=Pseudoruegeria aquimaris TaxID=393663 RepID=A0A1Y5SSC3_9RHOB|nr:helix-turn-helix domain-containing protein [Pseudoruegeria aquimaris]SLN47135.1 hypothetical protein PSA7680_02423 [Pseudoruegeria aquimaris]
MQPTCLNQKELAARWRISHRTLERWRWAREGPVYMKIGGRVVYRLEDILAFERAMLLGKTRDQVAYLDLVD